MRVRLLVLMAVTLALGVTLTACDAVAAYTVVNETDEELITWPFLEDCSMVIGNEDDYLNAETVKPRERHEYFEIYSGFSPEPRCVHVATSDRRLVLAERYEYGGRYVVEEPLRPYGDPIPERDDLPRQSFGETLREAHPAFLVFVGFSLTFGLAFLAGFLFAGFITVRFFYRYYAGKR